MSEYVQDELPLGTDLSAKHYVDKAKTEPYMKPVSDQAQNNAAIVAARIADIAATIAITPEPEPVAETPSWPWIGSSTGTA